MPLKTYADGTLFGEQYGSGSPRVLALHGWGRDRSDFTVALDGFDAVSLDLPGFGVSPPPPVPAGAAWYAERIRPVLETFPAPPVVVGHSFGGRVAVVAAADHPELVGGLLLIGVPLLHRADRTGARSPLGYRLVKLANRWRLLSDERLEAARSRYGSADYRAAAGVMRSVLVTAVNETYEEELRRLRCPVRLLWGAEDREVPVEIAERAAELAGGAPLEVLEGVGHHVPVSRPEAVAAALAEMLG